jgi:hypothetical protein
MCVDEKENCEPFGEMDDPIENITFKNIVASKVEHIFREFLKNSSFSPVITLDCSLEVCATFLNLISQKYKENSINPIVRLVLRERIEEYLEVLKAYIGAKESIEQSNIILIVRAELLEKEILKTIEKEMNPLALFAFYENIALSRLKESKFQVPILLELNERLRDLDLSKIKAFPIYIHDDSLYRLIYAFKKKKDLLTEGLDKQAFFPSFLKKDLFLPYCKGGAGKLLIEGTGRIFACELGYMRGDLLTTLKEGPLKPLLQSESIRQFRRRVADNAHQCQEICCLSYFCSGCPYREAYNKCEMMRELLNIFIEGEMGKL